jgi:hypothetical protein
MVHMNYCTIECGPKLANGDFPVHSHFLIVAALNLCCMKRDARGYNRVNPDLATLAVRA